MKISKSTVMKSRLAVAEGCREGLRGVTA
jgi:hypothetical protein